MNQQVIDLLTAERTSLTSQLNRVNAAIDALNASDPIVVNFTPTTTTNGTNGHTNGNGTNGHAVKGLGHVAGKSDTNGTNGTTSRRPLPVPRRAINGMTKAARFDRVLRNVRKPSTVAEIWNVSQKFAPEFTRNDVGIYTANAYKDGKLTRVGERGSYIYSPAK